MNRKQYAMERKFLKQKSFQDKPKRNPVLDEIARLEKEFIEANRDCTIADLTKYVMQEKEDDNRWAARGMVFWYSSGYEVKKWEKQCKEIVSLVRVEANKNYIKNENIDWYDFLLSYAIREYRYRNSKLVKALK